MPFVEIHIGKPLTAQEKETVMRSIAEQMPILPGKTAQNTMIEIAAADRDMYMGLEKKPLIFGDIRVFGPAPTEAKDQFIAALSATFEKLLGIPQDKQYYNIIEMPEWGSRGHLHS